MRIPMIFSAILFAATLLAQSPTTIARTSAPADTEPDAGSFATISPISAEVGISSAETPARTSAAWSSAAVANPAGTAPSAAAMLEPAMSALRGSAVVASRPVTSLIAPAADSRHPARRRLYWFSVVSLVAADVADSATSWNLRNAPGVHEANPLFGSQFGNRGIAIKSGLLGLQLAMEWIVCRRHPERTRFFTWINFAAAGTYGWTAARNSSLR